MRIGSKRKAHKDDKEDLTEYINFTASEGTKRGSPMKRTENKMLKHFHEIVTVAGKAPI